jgi:hypothetical protein
MPNHKECVGSLREVEAHLRSAGLLLRADLGRRGGVAAKCVQMAQWEIQLWLGDVSKPSGSPVRPGVSWHLRQATAASKNLGPRETMEA